MFKGNLEFHRALKFSVMQTITVCYVLVLQLTGAFNLGYSPDVSSPDFEGNFTKANSVKFQLFILGDMFLYFCIGNIEKSHRINTPR